ncbi:HAD family hydrolase [Metallosphaera tengchongensis]|uniref:HAD family hydrolase n=1 Tax=Metallosphaera tengchongensis TaxID=1532350 RepID=A0A6N0NV41_9CREN|nr:HAD family hydrolase [Metallosphaera tengchongensis]QKR00592.1 HAD family hydrolase [Metallosphaera tengchongensis]
MNPILLDLDSIIDFSSVQGIQEYRSLTFSLSLVSKYYPVSQLVKEVLKGSLTEAKPYPDSLTLEELGYRSRILVVTNLPKMEGKRLLMRYNLDAFVQDLVSPEDVNRFFPSKEFLDFSARKLNSVRGIMTLITPHVDQAIVARAQGLRVILLRSKVSLPQDLGIGIRDDLTQVAESLAQHRVDSTMGDSSLRCT